jgi:hypothetical protein
MKSNTPVEMTAYVAFNALNSLRHELHNEGRIDERDDVTGMALRVRRMASGEPPIVDDPRPEDMAELARETAKELRKRGGQADALGSGVYVPRPNGRPSEAAGLAWFPHIVFSSNFDNLGPIGCAGVIQAEEASRAQEWAGDAAKAVVCKWCFGSGRNSRFNDETREVEGRPCDHCLGTRQSRSRVTPNS